METMVVISPAYVPALSQLSQAMHLPFCLGIPAALKQTGPFKKPVSHFSAASEKCQRLSWLQNVMRPVNQRLPADLPGPLTEAQEDLFCLT